MGKHVPELRGYKLAPLDQVSGSTSSAWSPERAAANIVMLAKTQTMSAAKLSTTAVGSGVRYGGTGGAGAPHNYYN